MKMFVSVASIALLSTVLSGCKSDSGDQSNASESIQARVVDVKQVETPAVVRSTGTLHSRETTTLSAQVMGRVEQVLVREGDAVRAGQVLVVLDDATLRSSAEQAEAALNAAEQLQAAAQSNADLAASTLARYKQLETQKSVSPQEMDEVTRRAEAAQAQVNALKAQAGAVKAQQSGARAMLGYTRIVAPYAGTVTARTVDPGAMAAPGVPLIQIDSAGALELQTTVPESAIASVHKGMKIALAVDSLNGQHFEGAVTEIVPAADQASHSFLVKITLPSSFGLRAGIFASAEIPTGARQAVLAPRSAIVMRGSLACAYVVDNNGVAQLRYVTLGAENAGKVEALSGLSGGERLVDNPSDRDLAGKRIEVQP